MLVPCDTDVTITISFGGTKFFITSDTYNIGVVSGSTCMGGFSATPIDSGEQSLLDRSAHKSHVGQYSGHWVTSSCEMFTLISTLEIRGLDLLRDRCSCGK